MSLAPACASTSRWTHAATAVPVAAPGALALVDALAVAAIAPAVAVAVAATVAVAAVVAVAAAAAAGTTSAPALPFVRLQHDAGLCDDWPPPRNRQRNGTTELSFDDGEYADDAALLFCGRCDVEQQTPVLMAHFGDWGMEVHPGKLGMCTVSKRSPPALILN